MRNNTFGKILRELRIERRLSQRQLGEAFGVCNQTVSFWESGSREPDLDTLCKIADFFEVSCDFLLDRQQF
ncbi:MAG: helix-turn-helix transcriptional regulator [Clostridia bacterium]|nr:helix-turn-helix transcriptional regulator [Clostridia bacterium]MDY4083189.1 helix-turn-helix transcriptional regulator [Eubacteriales bacterium]